MRALSSVIAIVVAVAGTLALREASVLPMKLSPSDAAVLRLAWTARPERIEDCRPQSEEALSKLPAHMRQSVVCEGTTAAYRLEVRHDGRLIAEQVVRGGGFQHDRPLYVSREIQLAPGDAAIRVTFARTDSAKAPAASENQRDERSAGESLERQHQSPGMDPERRRREGEERRHSQEEVVPARLSLERRLRFASRQVILVTYDPQRRELIVVEAPPR